MKQAHYSDLDGSGPNVDFQPEYKFDHSMLLNTVMVVVLGYLLSWLVALPWRNRSKPSQQKRKANEQQQKTSLERTESQDCTQTSPRRPAPTIQSEFFSAISHHLPDRPFRFRAPDVDTEAADGHVWASPESMQRPKKKQQQQQQEYMTPTPPAKHVQWQQQQHESGWDAELLSKYASDSPYISCVEALQRSPLYRSHISQVRGRRLNYETAESHKLRVYRALRDVDPPGFQQLFSRQDIKEYDELTPSRLLSAFECLASSAINMVLLVAPWVLTALLPYRVPAALLWLALHLVAAGGGCTSPVAWLLRVHATEGEYNMLPSLTSLLTAAVLEAGLVVLTGGMGLLVTLAYRMLTKQRQSFGNRVMRFVPLREVVRPMHFNALGPAGASGAADAMLMDY